MSGVMFGPNKYARGFVDDSEWLDLPLSNGWVDYGSTSFDTPKYRLFGGLVFVRGLIKNGTITANTAVATLPVGFRPGPDLLMVMTKTNAGVCRFDISGTTGAIVGNSGLDATYTSLTLPPFIAER